MLDSWSVHLTLYRMTPCWTRDLCIWHCTEWRHVGLVICASDIVQNDAMLDSWSVSDIIHDDAMLDSWPMHLTLYTMMLDSWSVYLTLYMMTQCWTRDLCIWHYTWWRNVGLVICVSDIIHDDAMLDSWSVYQAWYRMMLDSWSVHLTLYRMMLDLWSVHLTLYRMTPCWTLDLCIWHYTEWLHVGLVICVSDIIQNDAMLDSWSVYLTLYRISPRWTRDLCIWHYTGWKHVGLVICVSDIIQNGFMLDSWSASDIIQNDDGLVICISDIYRMTPRWTCDLCIWHYTEWLHVGLVICIWHYIEWRHVGLVICVSDIIHDDAMLDSWSVYLTFYRMTPCWTHDLCIWHFTEWRHVELVIYVSGIIQNDVGLVICASDIIQNDAMLDSWSVYLT